MSSENFIFSFIYLLVEKMKNNRLRANWDFSHQFETFFLFIEINLPFSFFVFLSCSCNGSDIELIFERFAQTVVERLYWHWETDLNLIYISVSSNFDWGLWSTIKIETFLNLQISPAVLLQNFTFLEFLGASLFLYYLKCFSTFLNLSFYFLNSFPHCSSLWIFN